MVNVNWEMLRAVNVDEIGDDETSGELFQQVSEADVEEETDVTRLRLLFQVAQAIMQAKSVQAEVALEELAKLEEDRRPTGERDTRKMQGKIDTLNAQVTKLNAQLSNERERTGGVASIDDGGETLAQLRQQIESLKTEVREKDRVLSSERRDKDRLTARLEEAEKELRESTREVTRLRDDLEDSRQQVATTGGRSVDSDERQRVEAMEDDHRATVREKNRQIGELLDEVEVFERQNAQLQRQVAELRDKLQDSTIQMDGAANDYVRLQSAVQQSTVLAEELQQENEQLKLQSRDLAEQHEARIAADDEIIAAVSRRVEEWKTILIEKDDTILRLRNETVHLNESLALRGGSGSGGNSGVNTIGLLTRAVEDRDRIVTDLKRQLERAAVDLDESAACIEKLKSGQSGQTGAGEWQSRQIDSLQRRLHEREIEERELEERAREAETHAREKDSELAEALAQLARYERGEYGLEDAVREIKEQRAQVRLRDRQIADLTNSVNRAEIAVGELDEENEALREKLGLEREAVDADEVRARVAASRHRERALNDVLRGEVARLEEERLDLKREVRKLAQILGQRASKYSLTTEDARKLQAFADDLGTKGVAASTAGRADDQDAFQLREVFHEVTQQVRQLQLEMENAGKRMVIVDQQQDPIAGSSSEDKQLCNLLRIFQDTYPEKSFADQAKILKQMLLSCDKTGGVVSVNSSQQLNETDDVFIETVESGDIKEITKAEEEVVQEKNPEYKAEIETVEKNNERNRTGTLANSQLNAASQLNNRIAVYLKKLETSASDTSVGIVTLGVADSAVDDGSKLKEELERVKSENDKLRGERIEHKVKLEELGKLMSSLGAGKDETGLKIDLTELSRQLTVVKVGERNLLRKCSLLLECEKQLRHENDTYSREITAMRVAVLIRLGYLERFKDMAAFRIASLQRALESSVPLLEQEALRRQCEDLKAAHQELLVAQLLIQDRVSASPQSRQHLEFELQSTRERLRSLEERFRQAVAASPAGGGDGSSRKVALLEMSAADERQRADHVAMLNEEQRLIAARLEERNSQLEERVAQLSRLGLEQQRTESDLRIQLESSVSRAEHERACQQLEQLGAREILDREEICRLRELVEVAQNQIGDVELRREALEKEATALRQNLLDVQIGSDEKTIVGKLYRQLVGQQISEAASRHKLDGCQSQLEKIEALSLRLEQRCDEKDLIISATRNEAHVKTRNLAKRNRELGQLLAGLGGFVQCEALARTVTQLQSGHSQIRNDLDQTRELRFSAEEKVKELEIRNGALEEIVSRLRGGGLGDVDARVFDWHARLTELRVSEMKKVHLLERREFELDCKDKLMKKQEEIIATLEERLAWKETNHDEQVMSWETRERGQTAVPEKREFVALPQRQQVDSEQQLSTATITQRITAEVSDHRNENQNLKKNLAEANQRIDELEKLVRSRDRRDFDEQHREERAQQELEVAATVYHTEQTVRVAQSLVEDMKRRLAQKEDTVRKYEELLEQARADMAALSRDHHRETETMRAKILDLTGGTVRQLRRTANEDSERARQASQIPDHIARMNELQEVALQQDNAIGVLTDKLKSSSKEIRQWQLKVESTAKELLQEKDTQKQEYEAVIDKLEKEVGVLQGENADGKRELVETRAQLAEQVELASSAPLPTMRQAIGHLKREIGKKEKQIRALSSSLVELKSAMQEMTDESVKTKSEAAPEVTTTSDVPEQQTKVLREKVEALRAENRQLKADAKLKSAPGLELSDLRKSLARHVAVAEELRRDKAHLEEVIGELEAKVVRISRTEEPQVMEVTLLRGKVRQLEEHIARGTPPEKPYERGPTTGDPHKLDAYSAWDETKRLQQMIGKLRDKLSERDKEVTRLETNVTTCRGVVTRLEKARTVAEKKLKELQSGSSTNVKDGVSGTVKVHELQNRCNELQKEVTSLKQNLFNDKDAVIKDLQKRNEFLAVKLESVTRLWNSASVTASPRKTSSALVDELQKLRSGEENYQKEILRLSQENSELCFQVEMGQTELPQLRDRVQHLERYIDMLKNTVTDREEITSARTATDSPKRTRTGVSGKTPVELEMTIATLKKVVQKLQTENDRLTRQTRDHGRLVHGVEEENRRLQSELADIRAHLDPTSPVKQERGAAKIVAHNERLLLDLRSEVRANEALRLQLHTSSTEKELLEKSLAELQREMEELRAQCPSLSSLGGRRWESQVTVRRLEERLAASELESRHMIEQLGQLRSLVTDAVTLEETALRAGMISKGDKKKPTIKFRFEQLLKAGRN